MDDVKMYADYYKMDPQGENESDRDFRNRVAGKLRDMGRLVEGHEVHTGKRWDDPEGGDQVVTGIAGALAQMMQGVDYGARDGYRQIGDDIAAGYVALDGRPRMTPEMAMLLMKLFG